MNALETLAGALPETIDGTLDRLAALAAIRDAAVTLYDDTVAHLERFGPIVEARADYTGHKHETDAGKVVVTSPNRKPKIVDPDAFDAYALTHHPDRTGTRQRLNPSAIEQALAGKYDDPDPVPHAAPLVSGRLSKRLESVLLEVPDAFVVETVVEERLAADIVKNGTVLDDGDTVVDADGVPVPGLTAPYASTPRVTVTPDRDVVARLESEILAAVGRDDVAPEVDR